jgi:hypothetical protein
VDTLHEGDNDDDDDNNNKWETDRNLGRYRPARQLEKRCTCNVVADVSDFGFMLIPIHHGTLFLCYQYLHL